MIKSEIIDKECNKHGGFVNVINKCGGTLVSQIWERTMQEYSDQQNASLKEQLSIEKMNSENSKDSYNVIIHELQEQLAAKDKEIESLKERIIFWNEAHNDLIYQLTTPIQTTKC